MVRIIRFRYVKKPGCCRSEEGDQLLQLLLLSPGLPCLATRSEEDNRGLSPVGSSLLLPIFPAPLPLLLLRLLLLPLGPSVGEANRIRAAEHQVLSYPVPETSRDTGSTP